MLGFVPYLFLDSCFDNFEVLSAPKQTKLIKELHINPVELNILVQLKLQLDETANNYFEKLELLNNSIQNETDMKTIQKLQSLKKSNLVNTAEILIAYHKIANGYGNSKENGNYCILRAINQACIAPFQDDCTNCHYCVITTIGIQSVLNRYYDALRRFEINQNPKDLEIINKIIQPEINELATFIYSHLNDDEKQNFINLFIQEKEKIESKVKQREC